MNRPVKFRSGFAAIRAAGFIFPLLASGCFAPADFAGADADTARCAVPEDEMQLADQVLQLINFERAEADLAPVVVNPVLTKIASDFACRMIDHEFFLHQDPDTGAGPGDRAREAAYSFYAVGENLAAGQATAAEVMDVWMESPAHRDNILDARWQEVGIAVRFGGEYSIYWVQEFGDPVAPP